MSSIIDVLRKSVGRFTELESEYDRTMRKREAEGRRRYTLERDKYNNIIRYQRPNGYLYHLNLDEINQAFGITLETFKNRLKYIINNATITSNGDNVYTWLPNTVKTMPDLILKYFRTLDLDEELIKRNWDPCYVHLPSDSEYKTLYSEKLKWANFSAFNKNCQPLLDKDGIPIEVGTNIEFYTHFREIDAIYRKLINAEKIFGRDSLLKLSKKLSNEDSETLIKRLEMTSNEADILRSIGVNRIIKAVLREEYLEIIKLISKQLGVEIDKVYFCNKDFNIDKLKETGVHIRKIGCTYECNKFTILGHLHDKYLGEGVEGIARISYDKYILGQAILGDTIRAWKWDLNLYEIINNTDKTLMSGKLKPRSKYYTENIYEVMSLYTEAEVKNTINIENITSLAELKFMKKTDIAKAITTVADLKRIKHTEIYRFAVKNKVLNEKLVQEASIKIEILNKIKSQGKTIGFQAKVKDSCNGTTKLENITYDNMIRFIDRGMVMNATIVKSDEKAWHIRCTGNVGVIESPY